MPRGMNEAAEANRTPKPANLRDVPRYLRELSRDFFSRLLYIFRLVWDTRRSLLFVMLFMSVFNGVAPVIGSLIGARILNNLAAVYAGAELAFSVITVLLVWQFGYMLLRSSASRIYSMITSISGELVANHVKLQIMAKARDTDLMKYDSPEFYARLENASREAGSRPVQIMASTFTAASTVISMVSYIAVLFAVSPAAPWLIILVSIPTAVISFVYRRKNVDYMFRRSRARREMEYYSSTLTNKDLAKEVKMFSLGDELIKKYSDTFNDYFKGLRRLKVSECLWNVAAALLSGAVYCGIYIYIARGVYDGSVMVGSFSLYTGAIDAIGNGVGSLIATVASIYEGTLFIDNLIAFLNEKSTVVPILDQPRRVARGAGHTIEFRDVYFRYPGTDKDVLTGINLTVHPGETLSIVGLNGAGKTTLIKLMTRLYDVTGGQILLDGHDIREYDTKELYAMFGIIFQDFGKYAVTARENIEFGDLSRDAGLDEVEDAARHSGADDFISRMSQGYDTPLMRVFDSKGAELSIGQWQKLAIARAFYSDSDVLILDEPTASLDAIAEQDIFNRFGELRQDKTSVFISHRLSSSTIADTIVVMENGRITEKGSHRQLMDAKGTYYELFSTQAARYVEA